MRTVICFTNLQPGMASCNDPGASAVVDEAGQVADELGYDRDPGEHRHEVEPLRTRVRCQACTDDLVKGDRKTYPRRAPDLRRPTDGALAQVGVPGFSPSLPSPNRIVGASRWFVKDARPA
jgi:hypothetical protein